jgi:hypothetical protein
MDVYRQYITIHMDGTSAVRQRLTRVDDATGSFITAEG